MNKYDLSFSIYFSKFPDLDRETQKWIVQSVAGALYANHHITEDDKSSVQVILKEDKEIWKTLEELLETNEPISLFPIDVPTDLAETIFKYILKICMYDHKLASNELHYINEIGTKLGIETLRKRQILKQMIFCGKEELFLNLIDILGQEERYWLAVMVMKMIYADGEVHPKEIPYFNHVVNLLASGSKTLKSVKKEATLKPLEEFQKVHFDANTTELVMEYLLGIVMSDQDCSDRELKLIYQISQTIEYDNKKLEKLLDSIKSDFQFLFS